MRSKILVFSTLLLLILICISTCRNAGLWLVKKDELKHSDAIVILMGSMEDRILEAWDLYKQEMTQRIIIVDESMSAYKVLDKLGIDIISNSEQVRDALITLGIPADNIVILSGNATSTQMEAIRIRTYLTDNPDIDSLILVSSAPHTRRASMIFKYAFKQTENPIHIFCSPSSYTNFNAEKWWRDKEGCEAVLMEYLKMTHFLLFDKRKLKRSIK